MPAEGLPHDATVERIQNALALTAHETATATDQQFAVAILKLFDFGRAFGLAEIRDVAGMTAFYREVMRDVPSDLVIKAVREIIGSWKWPRMPAPADLLNAIADDLSERRAAKFAMERALWTAKQAAKRPTPKPMTPEQRAKFNEWLKARERRLNNTPDDEPTKAEAEAQFAEDRAKFFDQYPELAP